MALPPDPDNWFLTDLAAIEERIARAALSEVSPTIDHGDQRYRHLVENSLGLICTHDLEGTVLSVNPAAAESLGYEPRDGIGRNLREFLAPSTRARFDVYLARIKANSRDSGLMRVVRKDGAERLWLYRNVLYAEPGRPPYVLGHAIDVTERVAAETALRETHAQTLEATSRLAGRVAHAFNNLLTVILGNSELLMGALADDLERRVQVERIVRAASRGAGVARQLLAIGGRQVLELNPVNLNRIIAASRPLIERLAGPQVDVRFVLDRDLPSIKGDGAQLEQAILRLAANGRDAMPTGGTLTVETFSIETEDGAGAGPVPRSGRRVGLRVCDTGIGMDERTKAHVFEPFFTASSASIDTGLGLPTVYGIVRQLGGTITVESQPGGGTTFTILFPPAETFRPTRSVSRARLDAQTQRSETILLVDDEDDVRAVMREVLQAQGYQVRDAASGREALQLVETHEGPIDLLLTDVMMPGMGGHELHARLTARYPGLKVLFVSGYTDEVFLRGVAEGATILPKPFPLDALTGAVRDVLDRQSPVTDDPRESQDGGRRGRRETG